jgi:glycyl-tRNA synthetase
LVKNRKRNKLLEVSCEQANKKFKIPKFYAYHLAKIQQFYLDVLKIPRKKFRFRELSKEEKAFYNKIHFDMEIYLDTFKGFKEMGGLHFRGTHDLGGHQKKSKENLEILYNDKKILPSVLEISLGVDRDIYALLDIFYDEEKERNLFRFPAVLAPFDAGIFPLVKKEKKLVKKSKEVYDLLKKDFKLFFDEKDSIGRRYRRIDEIGVKAGITIDFDSLKKNDVTLRDRDSMKQIRIKIFELKDTLKKFLEGEKLEKLGKIIK